MVHHVAPNYSLPAVLSPLASSTPRAGAASSSPGSSTSTSSSDGGIGSTFLSLLTQELQNQDPTDPIDSTAMVGQMISLNQLDQLISINQLLGGNPGTLTGTSSTTGTGAISKPNATAAASQPGASLPQQTLNAALPAAPQPLFN